MSVFTVLASEPATMGKGPSSTTLPHRALGRASPPSLKAANTTARKITRKPVMIKRKPEDVRSDMEPSDRGTQLRLITVTNRGRW